MPALSNTYLLYGMYVTSIYYKYLKDSSLQTFLINVITFPLKELNPLPKDLVERILVLFLFWKNTLNLSHLNCAGTRELREFLNP